MFSAAFSNPWVQGVDAARRRIPAWLAALAAAVLAVGVVLGGSWLAGPAAALASPLGPAGQAAVGVAVVFLPLALVAIAAGALEGRSVTLIEPRPVSALGLGLALGLGGLALSVALVYLAGGVARGPVAPAPATAILVGLVVFAVQAGAEEIYFRGWLQPVLCARWGPWIGGAATAAIFALLHVAGGARSPMALVNLMLGGLFFGLLALRSGGLLAPFAAHTAWNWLEACGLGLEPDPGAGPLGTLVDLQLAGPGLWSGGADRLNGSLGVALVLGTLTLGLLAAGARAVASPQSSPEPGRSGPVP